MDNSQFTLGQPVECTYDYRGTTLGVITAKLRDDKGYWWYWVRTAPGCEDYREIEMHIRAVRLKPVFNIVWAA